MENMCSHKMAAKLYDSLRVELEGHVTSLSPVFREEIDDLQFLIVVDKQWRDHCQHMVSHLFCSVCSFRVQYTQLSLCVLSMREGTISLSTCL